MIARMPRFVFYEPGTDARITCGLREGVASNSDHCIYIRWLHWRFSCENLLCGHFYEMSIHSDSEFDFDATAPGHFAHEAPVTSATIRLIEFISEKRFKGVEKMVLNLLHLSTLRTGAQFTTFALKFASEMADGQLRGKILELVRGEPVLGLQAGEDMSTLADLHDHVPPPIVGVADVGMHDKVRLGFGTGLDTFKAFRSTDLWRRTRRIFGLCIASGLVGSNLETKAPGIYRRLSDGVDASKIDQLDVVENLLDFVRLVWDITTECIQTRLWTPLLAQDDSVKTLDGNMAHIKAAKPYYFQGTYEQVFKEHPMKYVFKVTDTLVCVQRAHKKCKGPEAAILTRYMFELIAIKAEVEEALTRPTTRVSPFAVKLVGTTGTGKTSLTNKLACDVLRMMDLPHDQQYIAWINSSDQYMSTVFNHTLGYIMDDVANTKVEVAKVDEIRPIIDIVNNAKVFVNKAALEDKGKVTINARVFIASTNQADLQAPKVSIEPTAALRRFNMHITVEVAKEFSTLKENQDSRPLANNETRVMRQDGSNDLPMVDPSKLDKGNASRHQLFTVHKVVPQRPSGGKDSNSSLCFRLVPGLYRVSYTTLMLAVRKEVDDHMKYQNQLLKGMQDDAKLGLCPHRITTEPYCDLCVEAKRLAAAAVPEASVSTLSSSEPVELTPNAGEGFMERLALARYCRHKHPFWWREPGECDECSREVAAEATRELQVEVDSIPSPSTAAESPPAGDFITRFFSLQDSHTTIIRGPEPQRPQPPTIWGRMSRPFENLQTTEMEMPRPGVVRMADTVLKGKWSIECLLLRWPRAALTALLWLPPVVAGGTGWGLTALLFSGSFMPCLVSLTFMGISAFTLGTSAMTWGRGRVAGYTLEQLKERLGGIALSAAGLASMVLVMAALTAGVTYICTGRKSEENPPKARDSSPKSAPKDEASAAPDLVTNGGCVGGASRPDPKPRPNEWVVTRKRKAYPVPCPRMATATREQLDARLERHLMNVEVHYTGCVVVTNGLMVCTNHLVFPGHNLYRKGPDGPVRSTIEKIVLRRDHQDAGPTFCCKVGVSNSRLLSSDMVVVNVGVGGTLAGVMDMLLLPEEIPDDAPVVEWSRARPPGVAQDYVVTRERYKVRHAHVVNKEHDWAYDGLSYERPTPTYKGLCGAILVAEGRYPRVLGMHTMGGSGEHARQGRAAYVNRAEVVEAIADLAKTCTNKSPIVSAPSTSLHTPAGFEPQTALGPLDERSVLHELPQDTHVTILGTLANGKGVRPKTRFEVSPWSGDVELYTGEPRKHMPPPNIGKVVTDVRRLQQTEGVQQLDPDTYALAYQDREEELLTLVEHSPELRDRMRPLSDWETCNGVPGCSSINGINRSTAAGFPMVGNKKQCTEPDPIEGFPDGFKFTEAFQAEVAKAYEVMGRLERPNFVFKGSHKDEPVKLGSLKNRVFMGSPSTLLFITRQLFLPIMRIYGLCPFETGSAVGINATGIEWHDMALYLRFYNRYRAIIGDWRHYDNSLAYQEVMAPFSLWITIASLTGNYTDAQLNAMWVVAEEHARYIAVLRTDVFMNDAGNSSGGGLTVYVNNEGNVLRDITAFYGLAATVEEKERGLHSKPRPEREHWTVGGVYLPANYRAELTSRPLMRGCSGRFADYARGCYYGDDFVLAVKEAEVPWYNQLTISKWFAEQGKTMTDANKEPFQHEYTPWEDVTFLKRAFRPDYDTRAYLAPLDMDSIYKCMHVVHKDLPDGIHAHYAQLMDSAQRELFQHGRLEYDRRVPQIEALATAKGCLPYMADGRVHSYEEMLEAWLSDNGGGSL